MKLPTAVLVIALSGCAAPIKPLPEAWAKMGMEQDEQGNLWYFDKARVTPWEKWRYQYMEPKDVNFVCQNLWRSVKVQFRACEYQGLMILPIGASDQLKAHEERHAAGWVHPRVGEFAE